MYTFWTQLTDLINHGQVHYFFLFFLFVWLMWLAKVFVSRLYKPVSEPFETTTSVVIPVVDEPEDLFRDVLTRIVGQDPDETVVVINGPENLPLERICAEFPTVTCIHTTTPGKRNAVKVGVENSTGEVVVLVDSDTIWTEDTLVELVKPFADETIGGVTTHQRILDPRRNWLSRFADWMEDIRCTFAMPAMSVMGEVGCLPGRTIAFRRNILERNMTAFMSEKFLGIHLEVSDDRTLTNYTLKDGYKTVYQRTSRVFTDCPTTVRKFVKQQYRWAKGSQYNTLRMLGWMLKNAPFLALVYLADIVIPFWFVGVVGLSAIRLVTGADSGVPHSLWLALAGCLGGFLLRQAPHIRRHPRDIVFLPAYILLVTFMLTPIRVIGFFRMAKDEGWGTRADSYTGSRQRHLLQVVPYLLGTAMLFAFTAAGLAIENSSVTAAALNHLAR